MSVSCVIMAEFSKTLSQAELTGLNRLLSEKVSYFSDKICFADQRDYKSKHVAEDGGIYIQEDFSGVQRFSETTAKIPFGAVAAISFTTDWWNADYNPDAPVPYYVAILLLLLQNPLVKHVWYLHDDQSYARPMTEDLTKAMLREYTEVWQNKAGEYYASNPAARTYIGVLSGAEWEALSAKGQFTRPDLFLRSIDETEHPKGYEGPCLCCYCTKGVSIFLKEALSQIEIE